MPVFTSSIFVQGQLPSSKGTLYTATGETSVTSIKLCNTDGSARTVNIYIKKSGGSSRRYSAKDLSLAAGAASQVLSFAEELRLGNGDLIEGDASTADVVDYTICGVVKS